MSASIWAPGETIDVNVNAESTNLEQPFTTTLGQSIYNLTSFTYVPNSNSLAIYRNGQRLVKGVDWNEDSSGTLFTLVPAVASTIIAGESVVAVAVIGSTSANATAAANSAQAAQLAATQAKQAAQNLPNATTGGPNTILVTDPTGSFWQYKTESELANLLGLPTIANTANAALPKSGGTLTGGLVYSVANSIASAAFLDLRGLAGNIVHVTGTTTISAVQMLVGQCIDIIFDGVLTLSHNNTNNNLPGAANIVTAAGDRARYFYDGATVYCLQYIQQNKMSGISGPSAAVNLTGTAVDFTGIPPWAKRVTISLFNMSTNGTSQRQIQLGSGSVLTSGYSSCGTNCTTNAVSTGSATTGMIIYGAKASDKISGIMTLVNIGNNYWVQSHSGAFSTATATFFGGGSVILSGALDRIRITANGTDSFSSGAANITWE